MDKTLSAGMHPVYPALINCNLSRTPGELAVNGMHPQAPAEKARSKAIGRKCVLMLLASQLFDCRIGRRLAVKLARSRLNRR